MYKTILAVVAFLFVALAVQLYEQERTQARIVRAQQQAEEAQAEIEAKAEESERNRQLTAGIQPKFAPAEDSLVPEIFAVPGGPPTEFSITVDATRMAGVAIAGHFAVSGNPHGGVEVYVFDEDDYSNWLNGNNSLVIYSSGRKSMGDLHVVLAKSGRYHLVFRNSVSSSALDVRADIKLQYEKIMTTS